MKTAGSHLMVAETALPGPATAFVWAVGVKVGPTKTAWALPAPTRLTTTAMTSTRTRKRICPPFRDPEDSGGLDRPLRSSETRRPGVNTPGPDSLFRMSEQPLEPRADWIREHYRRYLASNGADGHMWRPGVPTLLLTTRGRRSGRLRRTPLIYGEDDGRYLVVASYGGSHQHPDWYVNLDADPAVTIQVA